MKLVQKRYPMRLDVRVEESSMTPRSDGAGLKALPDKA